MKSEFEVATRIHYGTGTTIDFIVIFKVGDRVELRPGSVRNNGKPHNPINIGGTIVSIGSACVFRVDWDNGQCGIYDEKDLMPCRPTYGTVDTKEELTEGEITIGHVQSPYQPVKPDTQAPEPTETDKELGVRAFEVIKGLL